MKITKRAAAAGALGLAGLAVALVGPPLAVAATSDTAAGDSVIAAMGDRLQRIKDALAGLVSDGTITQEQADAVATTLDESDALRHGRGWHGGPGGMGGFAGHGGSRLLDLTAASDALGLSTEELREALTAEGTTLADIAQQEGVETSELVDALVAAATERIDRAVADGRLTEEQAEELTAALPDRIAAAVEEEFRGHGPRPGGPPWAGHRHGHGPGGPSDDEPTASETPS